MNKKIVSCDDNGNLLSKKCSLNNLSSYQNISKKTQQEQKELKPSSDSFVIKSSDEYFRELQDIAILRGGKLITSQYLGMNLVHEWECEKGHRWHAKPCDIKDKPSKSGTWCPTCAEENRKKYTTQFMIEFAKKKDGQFLSNEYLGWDIYHLWKCNHCGLEWEATPSNVIGQDRWCPICSQGLTERITRAFFEALFFAPFSKEANLSWLKEYGYHLDGFNPTLGIAFESHGIQHYKYHPFFHRNDPQNFNIQIKRDQYIREKCMEYNIILIEIGYELKEGVLRKIEYEEMEDNIRRKLFEFGVTPPNNNRINWREFKVSNPKYYEEIKKIVESKGGRIISPYYLGSDVHLEIDCGKGHIFKATPKNLRALPSRKGRWCPDCALENKKKYSIEDMESLAKKKGGQFLGIQDNNDPEKLVKEFLGVDKYHWWQCDVCNTIWSAKPSVIIGAPSYPSGSWCPKCGKENRNKILSEMGKQNIGKAQQEILKLLNREGGRFIFEIANSLDFSATNVQSSLSHLLDRDLVKRKKEKNISDTTSLKNTDLYKYYITSKGLDILKSLEHDS